MYHPWQFSPLTLAGARQRHITAIAHVFAPGIMYAQSYGPPTTVLIKENKKRASTTLNAFGYQWPNINFLNVLLQR